MVHYSVIEEDRLKLAQHIEEQKAQRRRISKHVTTIRQIVRKAGLNTNRYTDYKPEDDMPNNQTLIAYGEPIDEEKNKSDAVVLPETANTLVKVASVTQEAITTIINGPKEAPVTDFYRNLSKSNHKE